MFGRSSSYTRNTRHTLCKSTFAVRQSNDLLCAHRFIIQNDYGIDWDGPVSSEGDARVEVPDTPCPLTALKYEQLKGHVNPLEECNDYGIGLYTAAKVFVNNIS